MVFKLSSAAEAEIYWSEHRKHLDKLIEEKDELISAIGSSTATGETYTEIENYFKAAERIRSYGNGIPFHRAKKLEQAELAVGKIKEELLKQFSGYSSLESKIHGEVEKWHTNGKNGKLYNEILADCANYKNIERIARLLKIGGASGFYLDGAGVSELLSPTSYTSIVSQYASSNTKEELQQARQSLGKNVWQKVEAEKERLLQKYSGKLSKAETEFIKAFPGKKWGELDAEMSKVVAHAEEYLGKKGEIEKETQFVREDITELLSVESIPECIAKITSKSLVNRSFNGEGTIYLKESSTFYEQEVQRREKVRGEKQQFVQLKLEEQFRELDTSFDGEKALELSIMKNYEQKAAQLHQYYQRAGLDCSPVSGFEDKLKRMKSHLISFPTAKPKIISGEAIVKEEAKVSVKELPISAPLPPVENVPQVVVAPEVEYSFQRPLDFTEFAWDYYPKAGDSRLAKLCRQVVGVQDNGELLIMGLPERLMRINRKELTDLGAALSGKDVQAYQLLKGGVEKYAG